MIPAWRTGTVQVELRPSSEPEIAEADAPGRGLRLERHPEADAWTVQAPLFGQLPVSWAADGDRVLVDTSALRLLRSIGRPAELDPRHVLQAVAGRLETCRSPFLGCRRVPAGHRLVVGPSGVRTERASSVPRPASAGAAGPRAAALMERLDESLRKAVRERLAGGAACLLSGGLDSALLLAVAVEGTGPPPRAYTLAGLDGADGDGARLTAEHLGVPLSMVRVDPRTLAGVAAAAVLACETPLHGSLAVAKDVFLREVARDLSGAAVLSGAGADELFLGAPATLRPNPRGQTPRDREADADLVAARGVLVPSALDRLPNAVRPENAVERRMHALLHDLPCGVLPPEARPGAPEGPAVAFPYLDEGVARVALELPPSLLARAGRGKLALRALARGRLPDALVDAEKTPVLARPDPVAREAWRGVLAATVVEGGALPEGTFRLDRVAALLDAWTGGRLPRDRDAAAERLLLRLFSFGVLARAAESG